MTSEDIKKEPEREDNSAVPAFSVSGQFMMTSEEKAIPSEDFNPRKIVALTLDDSLARLFECLTLEYSGSILLTPKWKNFRSQKLKFAEKTRINNAIWRSWHIQFKELKRPLFCQFDNPLTEMAKKPRPVTLMIEGKYWKRKLEAVAAEYQKWRVFYKHMVEDKFQDVELQHQTEEILRLDQEISDHLREREKKRKFSLANQAQSPGNDMGSPLSLVVSQALEMVDSCNLMENMVFSLPDTLFSSIAKNPSLGRVRSGTFKDTADTVQPTLDTLQPSLEAMTPVLDELIEQLEASMKGSELNWDFDSLEKPCFSPMGLIQSSSAAVVEPMDHSGQYSQPYASMGNIITSSPVKTPWSDQGNTVTLPTHTMYPASSVSQMEVQLPIWTSAPIIHPNVIGYQTIGMPGNLPPQGQNAVRTMPNSSTSMIDMTGSTPVFTTRPYLPTTSIGKRLPTTPSACAVEASAARLPRNSSDSQLYLLAAGDSQSKPRTQLPVELQAPNLVAQLKLTKPRQMIIEEKAKRLRIPRNRSAPGLASLDSTTQFKKTPLAGGVRAKKLGRIPRNRSDSALASLVRQSEQSSSTARRDSESGDSPPSMPAVLTQSATRQQGQTPNVLGKQQLYHPRSEGEASRPPSQLVHDMVSHLMSKGISMEEILNRLTSMAAAGTLPQAQSISHQITSAAGSMATMLQEQQQETSLIASPPYPAPQPFPTSPPPPASTATTPRSRRKLQTPRPSIKAESPAVSERSGIRSSNNLVQSLVRQNRSSTETRVPSVESASAVIIESNPRWENQTSTVSHTLSHMSQPLNAQSAGVGPYPMDVEGGNIDPSESSVGNKKTRGRIASTPSPNSSYLPSMVMTTPTSSTVHSEAVASTSSTTSVADNRYGPATPTPNTVITSVLPSKGRTGPRSDKRAPKESYMEHRRMVHVSAEQKRRGHIKMGFDQFIEMVPALTIQAQGSTKISKASVLKKSVDYILEVQQEHENMTKERDKLKREIEQLNVEISNCQQQLPETGVMVNRQNYSGFEAWFNRYIQDRTEENPKFWIFSVLMRPIFEEYISGVSTNSPEEFYQSVINWLNESCCLPKLRPSVLSSLRELIKNTSILSDPSKFPEQARLAASGLSSQATGFDGLPR